MAVFRHGKAGVFKVGTAGTPATATDRSDMIEEVSFPREIDTAETTTFGAAAKTYVVGLSGSTISFTGKFDNAGDTALAAIVGLDTPVAIEYGPEGSTTGRVKYTASGYLTSYEVTANVGDVVSATGQFQITGPVTRGSY